MSRPAYCPGCGSTLPGDERTAMPILEPESGDGGYDCYCGACGWSGDIYPDDEQGIYE